MYKEGLKYTHVNQDDMCTYTNKTEMDTLAWIKHKCTHVQLQKEIHKCTNTHVQIGEHVTHVQLNMTTIYKQTMTTIYKQTEHIFTLTNNIMFELLVFTRMLENI
jgi:hypothetical protein